MKLDLTQKALVIWDVFKGQMTDKVMEKLHSLHSLHCEFVPVPANMTHIFQPLDLTVNGSSKNYMKNKFIDDIDVDFKFTTMKPLHAQWLVSMYNFFTTEKGARIIFKRMEEGRNSWHCG